MIRSNIEDSLPNQKNTEEEHFQVVGNGICIAYHGKEDTIVFPDNVKELSNYLFFGNYHIKQVYLPKKLHTIGAFAFAFCTQLKEITIPDSLHVIETSAFYFCHQLKSVHFPSLSRLSYLGQDAFLGTKYWKTTEASMNQKEHPQIFQFGSHILLKSFGFQKICVPHGIKSIHSQAFSGNTQLTHIKLPSSVEYLGSSSFADCTHLKSVTLSENITTVPSFCFQNCRSLRSITLPNGIKKIGKGAFKGCYNLEKIIFPEHLEEIDSDTFEDCPFLVMPIFDIEENDDDDFDNDK